jgi:hypothetical protein
MFIKDMEQVTLAKEEELNKSEDNLMLILKHVIYEFTCSHGLQATDNIQSGEWFELDFTEIIKDVESIIAFLEKKIPIETNIKRFGDARMRVYNQEVII